eukprot:gene327-128_t
MREGDEGDASVEEHVGSKGAAAAAGKTAGPNSDEVSPQSQSSASESSSVSVPGSSPIELPDSSAISALVGGGASAQNTRKGTKAVRNGLGEEGSLEERPAEGASGVLPKRLNPSGAKDPHSIELLKSIQQRANDREALTELLSGTSTREKGVLCDPSDFVLETLSGAAKLRDTLGPLLRSIVDGSVSLDGKSAGSVAMAGAAEAGGDLEMMDEEGLVEKFGDTGKLAMHLSQFEQVLVEHCQNIFLEQERQMGYQLEMKNSQIDELNRVVQEAVARERQVSADLNMLQDAMAAGGGLDVDGERAPRGSQAGMEEEIAALTRSVAQLQSQCDAADEKSSSGKKALSPEAAVLQTQLESSREEVAALEKRAEIAEAYAVQLEVGLNAYKAECDLLDVQVCGYKAVIETAEESQLNAAQADMVAKLRLALLPEKPKGSNSVRLNPSAVFPRGKLGSGSTLEDLILQVKEDRLMMLATLQRRHEAMLKQREKHERRLRLEVAAAKDEIQLMRRKLVGSKKAGADEPASLLAHARYVVELDRMERAHALEKAKWEGELLSLRKEFEEKDVKRREEYEDIRRGYEQILGGQEYTPSNLTTPRDKEERGRPLSLKAANLRKALANRSKSVPCRELRAMSGKGSRSASQPAASAGQASVAAKKDPSFLGKAIAEAIKEVLKVQENDFMEDLCGQPLSGGGEGDGKSGMLFFFSPKAKYIVKTLKVAEHSLMVDGGFLESYVKHCEKDPMTTMMPRFFMVIKVTVTGPGESGDPKRLVVMNGLFNTPLDLHDRYDLKGSLYGRYSKLASQGFAEKVTLKDLNYAQDGNRSIQILNYEQFCGAIKRDVQFLIKWELMDYSLLLGIHFCKAIPSHKGGVQPRPLTEGAVDGWPQLDPKVVDPSGKMQRGMWAQGVPAMHVVFGQQERCVVYMGIIDILQVYDYQKVAEHFLKTAILMQKDVSAVSPEDYGNRFISFMNKCFAKNAAVPDPETLFLKDASHASPGGRTPECPSPATGSGLGAASSDIPTKKLKEGPGAKKAGKKK